LPSRVFVVDDLADEHPVDAERRSDSIQVFGRELVGRSRALALDGPRNATRLDDLATDCFCVSADLTAAEVVVHRTGPIVEAVGASMSLPGLAPPVRSEGRFLVDGGVLNNVPADVMAATREGPVIAVDVMTPAPLGHKTGRSPSIIETLARATVIGSPARPRLAPAGSGTRT